MKRVTLVLLALMFLVACGPKGMNLVYNDQPGSALKLDPIYLKIKDVRSDKMLVSPAVMQKDLFTSVGDRLSLTAKGTSGRTVQLKNVSVSEAFQEAIRTRLQDLGIGLLPSPNPQGDSLIIEVEKFQLGLGPKRTFTAEAVYTARFFRGAKQVFNSRITGSAEKFYLVGQSTGEDALSEAFSSAVNGLDLRAITQ